MSENHHILDFLHQTEQLKMLLRHSWLSNGRQESVAEHTWRMMLMALLTHSYLDEKVNLNRVLKLSLVHDLPEIIATDFPAYKDQPRDKAARERAGLKKLTNDLPAKLKEEIQELWEEYEASETPEARFAKALDKLEVLIQHNEASLDTYAAEEFPYNFVHANKQVSYDEFLKTFRKLIKNETLQKYRDAKVDEELYEQALKKNFTEPE